MSAVKQFKRKIERAFKAKYFLFSTDELNRYFRNIYGISHHALGVIFPKSEDEIQNIVLLARKYRIRLYPLSTGKNYGLGSKIPASNGHIVVDLKKLNRISDFNPILGTVRIQAGVTQVQLYEFLRRKRANFELNVTGSAHDSSIVGNILERGIGHFGPRAYDLLSLKVVLGTGEILDTGARVYSNGGDAVSRFGIGPDLTQVFSQSSFGIVTEATIRLRASSPDVTFLNFEQGCSQTTAAFVDELMVLSRAKLLPSNLHISNLHRRLSVLTPLVARQENLPIEEVKRIIKKGAALRLSASSTITGDPAVTKTIITQIRLRKLNSNFSNESLEQALRVPDILSKASRGTAQHAKGIPCSDALLSIGYGQQELISEKIEQSNSGALFLVPVIPAIGRDVDKAIRIIERNFAAYEFPAYITLNLVDDLFFEAVVNLTFDKRYPTQTNLARKAIIETQFALTKQGYVPQRLSIFQMRHFKTIKPSHRKVIRDIKKVFDPDSILSCGRYQFGIAQ